MPVGEALLVMLLVKAMIRRSRVSSGLSSGGNARERLGKDGVTESHDKVSRLSPGEQFSSICGLFLDKVTWLLCELNCFLVP